MKHWTPAGDAEARRMDRDYATVRIEKLEELIATFEQMPQSLFVVGHILQYNEERDRILELYPELL